MPEPSPHGVDILIVDDTQHNITLLEMILEDAEYSTACAYNGDEAIDMAEKLRPRVILMDVMMPGIDGFETCRRLKKKSSTHNIPVIFVTAKSAETDEMEGFEAGGVDYLIKPVNEAIVLARVKTQLELRSYRESLEIQIEQRTEDLNNTLRELAHSSRIKDEFLSTISHELRTPLNGIHGSLQLLRDSELLPQQMLLVDTASHSVNDLTHIVGNILLLTESMAGSLRLCHKAFSLRNYLKKLIKQVEPAILLKGLMFDWQIAENVPDSFIGDPAQFSRVIGHLLANATKFTPKGAINLDVSLNSQNTTETHSDVIVKVSDTGIGIEPDKQELIFKLFKQGDSYFNRQFGGLGIGLPICQILVTLMNGSIGFTSDRDAGSIFEVNIPLMINDKPPQKIQTEQPLDISGEQTVLIVEDNTINLLVEKTILEKCGFSVRTANNGKEALELLKVEKIDAILMDCQMPILDGFETTRCIRNSSSHIKNIPIIAVTANASSLDRERCFNAGMNDYLAKPISTTSLKAKLVKWLI